MSNSLKDQLIALGLAQNKKSGPAKPAKKQARGSRGKHPADESKAPSLEQAYRLRKNEEQKQADRVRKRKLAEDRRRRQLNIDIRAIVDKHRLNDPNAEIARNFIYKSRIRKVMVTPEQLIAVNAGELGVAYLMGGYYLLAPEHIEAVRKLSPEHVPGLLAGGEDEEDHPVPDDLTW